MLEPFAFHTFIMFFDQFNVANSISIQKLTKEITRLVFEIDIYQERNTNMRWSLYYNGKLNLKNVRFFWLIVVSVTTAFHEGSWKVKR